MPAEIVLIGATGGSGSRAIAECFEQSGWFIGADLNDSLDSMPFARLLDRYINLWWDYKKGKVGHFKFEDFKQEWNDTLKLHVNGALNDKILIKNPRSLLILDLLFLINSEFRFVHLVRNGLSMASSSNRNQLVLNADSVLDRKVLPDESEEECQFRLWCKVNTTGFSAGIDQPNRYTLLRYEDFCAEPVVSMKRLSDELQIETDLQNIDAAGFVSSARQSKLDLQAALNDNGRRAMELFGYTC